MTDVNQHGMETEFSFKATGSKQYIKAQLQAAMAELGYTAPKQISWKWGFVWGCMFMAVLNIGDVHICAGECDGQGIVLMETLK